MRKNNRLILVVLPALLLISWHGVAQAMGKRPGQGRVAAVSRLTPEQERQAKAEFDSLMAIYDPWKAIKEYTEQEESLKKGNTSKADILEALKEIDRKYPRSQNGDAVLSNIVLLYMHFSPQKDTTIEGERFAQHNPKYDEHYRETLEYALRLADEYPQSKYAEKALLRIGLQYAGFLDERDGKYIKPFVEFVKRFPQSRFIMIPLFMISATAEYETGGVDFETCMWAYTLWRKKYDDGYFYLNYLDDPKIEALYDDKRKRDKLMEEIEREKQEVGKKLLGAGKFVSSISEALDNYRNAHNEYLTYQTKSSDDLYNKLLPYYVDSNLYKKYNPFVKYKDVKLNYFRSEKNKYEFELQLFDIKKKYITDLSVPKPGRR